jgi:AcrR family transcriptional regulator
VDVDPFAAPPALGAAAMTGEPGGVDADPSRKGRGRPRAADRTEAILEAADELFDEVGYDQLTVQAIARRAGVGLATIYRRWPTKQALLAEVLRRRRDRTRAPAGDGPLERLTDVSRMLARSTLGPQREFLPGLLAAIRSDDELAEALRTGVLEPLRQLFRQDLVALLGPDHPLIDLLVDLAPGICVFRAFAPGDPGDPDEFVAQLDVLLRTLADQ